MAPIPSWQSLALLAVIAVIARFAAGRVWLHDIGTRPGDGLSQLRLVWLATACVVALTALTAALLAGAWVARIDRQIRTWVQALHDDAFVQLSIFITSMGDFEALLAVTIVTAGLLWAHGRHRDVAGLAVSALGSQAATYILKYAIGRPRPEFETFASAMTPSFPSGHATGAVAVYGFVVYAVARRLPRRARFEVTFWGAAFIVLVAATRLILGVHYASDVMAGLLLGAFWLIAGCYTARHD